LPNEKRSLHHWGIAYFTGVANLKEINWNTIDPIG
jgi:hypothetical protein